MKVRQVKLKSPMWTGVKFRGVTMENEMHSAPTLDLPLDLVTFLKVGKQLEYDPALCEAGAITLLPLSELKLERFPVETSGSELAEEDPHYPDLNSYLVLAVNLVASCTGDYESVGLLLWLPLEKRYGVWDSSHCTIVMFGAEVTWESIAASAAAHINAGWTGMDPTSPETTELVPWPAHPYGHKQVYDPQPV